MFRRLAAAVAVLTAVAAGAAPAGADPRTWPEVIPLDAGYRPEGIASAGGTRLYVGSIPTGAVSVVDARTGDVTPLVAGRPGRAAIGLEEAGERLLVAGGPTGQVFVYDARTGADVAEITLSADDNRFINDVVVSGGGAWFTDSRSEVLWRVDLETLEPEALPVTGVTFDFDPPATNNFNGIEASADGRTLYVIQSNTGILWAVDATTGAARAVADGLANGDGLLRQGQTMYVVQNRLNQVAVVDLRSGARVDTITSDAFRVPTTVARIGDRLFLPNARFGTADPDAIDYEVVSVRR
jgi:sugar lactone lactonase YvrE